MGKKEEAMAILDEKYDKTIEEETLEEEDEPEKTSKPRGNTIGSVIGALVALVVGVAVVLPTITSVTSQNQDVSKAFETAAGLIPVMICVTVLLVVVAILGGSKE